MNKFKFIFIIFISQLLMGLNPWAPPLTDSMPSNLDLNSSTKKFYANAIETNGTSCTNVILQNDAVNLDNVRDQDTLGWCYAYAASDLLSFKFNEKISAMSLNSSEHSIKDQITNGLFRIGGHSHRVIKEYYEKYNGYCKEEDLPSSDFQFCAHTNYVSFLRELFQISNVNDELDENKLGPCFNSEILKAFPGISLKDINTLMQENGKHKIIENIYEKQCKNLVHEDYEPKYKLMGGNVHNAYQMLENMNKKLENGEIVEIYYHYDQVSKDLGVGVNHASVIVGKQYNKETKKCEYLIRNSLGKICNQDESVDVHCHKNCENGNCTYSGHFWVSEDILKKALYGTLNLED